MIGNVRLTTPIQNTLTVLEHEKKVCNEPAMKLSQILERSPIPTFVIDANSKIVHWNRACELLTGICANEVIGTDRHQEAFYMERRPVMADLIVSQASAGEMAKFYGGKLKNSKLTNEGYEGEDFFPKLGESGRVLFFTACPIKDAAGNITGAIETIQDITERRIAEQKQRSSEARYRLLFELANDAIFLLKDGRIVDCNQKVSGLFSCAREDFIGRTLLDFSPEYQSAGVRSADEIHKKKQIYSKNVSLIFDWRFQKAGGLLFDAEVSIARFEINDTRHSIGIVRDITERKLLFDTLKEREKELDEKTRYLEKVNQALKASLDHREVEKRSVEENMLINLKRFILPYIEELGKCKISMDAKAYLNIIDTNLNDLISQFGNTIFSKYMDFTPAEVRIADLIRGGKNSKDIADMLGMSPSSVQWHRKNIRTKLGLTNKKINLHIYLNSLSE